ncbi:MAG: isochorismatase family protein [Parachlamydiales bacterium]
MRAQRSEIALCVIDVQEKLFPKIEGHKGILAEMERVVRAFQLLGLPVIGTEQYPKGLGKMVEPLQSLVGTFHEKTHFSAAGALPQERRQWALVGIEAHVCVLQTALDLVERGCEVVVPRGAIGSRRDVDCRTAADEMRHAGVRITSVESLLFELLGDAKDPAFKDISALIK